MNQFAAPARRRACHKLIADTAKGIAEAAYEELAKDDLFFKTWPNRKVFVTKWWPTYIPAARATLATMLTKPEHFSLHSQIEDALIKDWTLIPQNKRVQLPV